MTEHASVRFDDLVRGHSRELDGFVLTLETREPSEVNDLLDEVEHLVATGLFAGGFVSYDAARAFDLAMPGPATSARDDRVRPHFSHPDLPLAWFALYRGQREVPRIDRQSRARRTLAPAFTSEISESDYLDLVNRVMRHLEVGDTYQCNLTYRLSGTTFADPYDWYHDLTSVQQGSECAYINTGRFAIASASPELFFDWDGARVLTRPMKGTRARGKSAGEDEAMRVWLETSPKERAENVMIVDLLRNDLGRIARFGGVEVANLFAVEQYETLWQMTSSITADPRPGTTLAELFRALFPCGSVTGAPKVRTMEIIAGCERSPRGLYCGAIGLVAPAPSGITARFNVAIRSLVVDQESGLAIYGTGGAITIGSDPLDEYAESVVKTAILSRATEDFSLIETMAFEPRLGIRNLEAHLARLRSSSGYFGFAFDESDIALALDDAMRDVDQLTRVRLLLRRDGSVQVSTALLPRRPQGPVLLELDDEPVFSNDPMLYHKTTIRESYERRALRHLDADDVILCNEREEITETSIANIVARIDRRWWTPALNSGCLPGIERARLLREGRVHERVLSYEDLTHAEALGVISSLRGFRQATLDRTAVFVGPGPQDTIHAP